MAARTKQREFQAPGGAAFGLVARGPRSRPPEYRILERRRAEEERSRAQDTIDADRKFELKTKWEMRTDDKLKANEIHRRVASATAATDNKLDERRARLRRMLEEEEQQLRAEMAAQIETPLDRQARMRERVKQLRDAREEERKAESAKRREQLWYDNCSELRPLRSKKETELVRERNLLQLEEKEALRQQEAAMDQAFEQMLQEDLQRKAERERRDQERARQAALEARAVLEEQIEAVRIARAEEEALRQERARLLVEEAKLREEEERQAKEQERRRQQRLQKQMARYNAVAKAAKEREMQEDLARDMELISKMMKEAADEEKGTAERKAIEARERALYCEFAMQQKAMQQEREREIDQLFAAEAERVWQQRIAKWDAEKQARDKLMNEVIETRKKQIAAKLAEVEEREIEAAREQRMREEAAEEHRRYEEMCAEERRDLDQQYRSELTAQMENERARRQREIDEEQQLNEAVRAAQHREGEKIRNVLENFTLDGAPVGTVRRRAAPF